MSIVLRNLFVSDALEETASCLSVRKLVSAGKLFLSCVRMVVGCTCG